MSAGIVIMPSAAHAELYDFHLEHEKSGRCLDSNSQGDVYTLPCVWGNDFQTWNKRPSSTQFQNKATGRCLDSNDSYKVYTLPCDSSGGNRYQKWNSYTAEGGYSKYVNSRTRGALDGDTKGNVYTRDDDAESNYNHYQHWRPVNYG
ncbi:RICIN domain-containing protein [Paractinoplanes hotanensis]|uniref:RICIN domain-containing protein n=1 Tax=Paractinoplanes hotanensis TaxID=2906497 RepID=A0ABT0YC39_9ACTN|nr:ricin-type beta-trefoil lectin domain protein [Actinoplanes hotanensis]MCM4083620.1 RICIN domain-containing protein [Actinoplanes hotanensis]